MDHSILQECDKFTMSDFSPFHIPCIPNGIINREKLQC